MNPNAFFLDTKHRMQTSPFLYRFFTRLRKAGFTLGQSEYQLLLQALQAGFGLENDQESLLRLCKCLWLTSPQDEAEFLYQYRETIEEWKHNKEFADISKEKEADGGNSLTQKEKTAAEKKPKTTDSVTQKEAIAQSELREEFVEASIKIEKEEAEDSASSENLLPAHAYVMRDYLPLSRRKLQQQWRRLRQLRREGPSTVIDIVATVKETAKNQFLLEPQLMPSRQNTTRLILLIDHQGSMIAFEAMAQRLKHTLLQSGAFRKAEVYYFHNVPDKKLYTDPSHNHSVFLKTVLQASSSKRNLLLVYSDAGAARQQLGSGRLEATQAFLQQAKKSVRKIAWLNPIPAYRWEESAAELICKEVDMFEATPTGIIDALNYLKGRKRSVL